MAKKKTVGEWLFENKVTLVFVFLCIGGTIASGQSVSYVVNELMTRIARNAFTILSLLIPVLAGMGLNFGIVIGAIATQIALFLTTHWRIAGITGILATAALATPLAILFGFLVGKLFNKMKGSEMIGGLVLGYFADGLYQFLFLFIFGGVIAINDPKLMISTGIGVKNTIDLTETTKYALDTVPLLSVIEIAFYIVIAVTVLSALYKLVKKQAVDWKRTGGTLIASVVVYALTFIPTVERFLAQDRMLLLNAVEIACAAVALWQLWMIVQHKFIRKQAGFDVRRPLVFIALAALAYAATYLQVVYDVLISTRLPMTTYLCILALCFMNTALLRTRLGQNMRAVGQNRVVANAAGIDVDKTRIIAMIFSTVLASWGQLIYLQNIGTFSTYGAHQQVGQYAIASLLVGGASVQKATNKQAILGVILFHTMFIVAPLAGKELLGDAMIGEYFRVFVSYGVIALALAMHAWKKVAKADTKKAQA